MFKVEILSLHEEGRCFVIGELNGNFSALSFFVNAVDLDPRTDRIMLNGNFLGMAPSSREVLAWLNKPWVHAVAGLNEIGVLNRLRNSERPSLMGQWLAFVSAEMRKELESALAQLPIAIECHHQDRLAVVSNKPLTTEQWQGTKASIFSWESSPESIFTLFEDRLTALSLLKNDSSHQDVRTGNPLSVSSLALENPSLPKAGKHHVILTGSAHMTHGAIYHGSCLLPYIELSSFINRENESEQWLGQVVIDQKSYQMKNSYLRGL